MRARVLLTLGILLALVTLAHAEARPFVGKWKLSKVSTASGPVAKDKLAQGSLTWEFKEDGRMTITVTAGAKTGSSSGTWKLDGNKLSITENTQVNVVTFKRKGAELVLAGTGKSTVVMTFVKAR